MSETHHMVGGEVPGGSTAGPARVGLGEVVRFVVVGSSAVAIDFVIYFTLLSRTSLSPSIAKGISFVTVALIAGVLTRVFVFRARGPAGRQLLGVLLLYVVSFGLNNGVNALLLHQGTSALWAWFFATGSSTAANFVGMKFVIFRGARR